MSRGWHVCAVRVQTRRTGPGGQPEFSGCILAPAGPGPRRHGRRSRHRHAAAPRRRSRHGRRSRHRHAAAPRRSSRHREPRLAPAPSAGRRVGGPGAQRAPPRYISLPPSLLLLTSLPPGPSSTARRDGQDDQSESCPTSATSESERQLGRRDTWRHASDWGRPPRGGVARDSEARGPMGPRGYPSLGGGAWTPWRARIGDGGMCGSGLCSGAAGGVAPGPTAPRGARP